MFAGLRGRGLQNYSYACGVDTAEILGKTYTPRLLDAQLADALETAGAVVIEGPRACGKTMTAVHAGASFVALDDPTTAALAEISPVSLLEGDRPRVLDEWQLNPDLWNMVRRSVDTSEEPGQFILTGSSVPSDDVTRHTGAGRFLKLRQRTMTLAERGLSTNTVSLAELFNGNSVDADNSTATIDDAIDWVSSTGFPALSALDTRRANQMLRAYLEEVATTDLERVATVSHSPVVIERLLTSLARSVASEVTYRTLAADLETVAASITPETVSNYVGHLQRLFVVEAQQAWAPKLRSRARLRTSPKLHLAEPALAVSLLNASPSNLMNDLETLGFLFESLVFHDLAVLAGTLGGKVYHYRDSNGHEIDLVIVLPDGRWAAIEVKLGAKQIPKGAKSLNAAINQIDVSTSNKPAFRAVITALGPTLPLTDGTVTFPINALAA